MEVLIAVGTLALGMLFIASVFPAGLFWTATSSERTIAAVVADEAFAKIKLYDFDPLTIPPNAQRSLEIVPLKAGGTVQDVRVFAYPSTPSADPNSKRYWWSAICRKVDANDIQVTVFVCRKVGQANNYYSFDSGRPGAMPVNISGIVNNELTIAGNPNLVSDGYTIVNNADGQIYRVLEKYPASPNVIRLDKNWQGSTVNPVVWVVPPPIGGGRSPCIAVYQKVMRF
jgi:hypothetical protein